MHIIGEIVNIPGVMEDAIEVLEGKRRILVFTGAGISTESGIPDFRGPKGLWTKVDPEDFTIDRYLERRDRRVQGWKMHAAGELWGARSKVQPNDAHRAVAALWEAGIVGGCITQNVDGLHGLAGLPDPALSEIHGNVRMSMCVSCDDRRPIESILERVDAGEDDPPCEVCGGILKPSTVMFGELLPDEAIGRAREFADRADSVLVVGSTLSVYPAANFALEVAGRGHPLVIVNLGPTDHDRLATVRIQAKAGKAMTQLAARLTP